MGRRALVIGINRYENVRKLEDCVADANAMAELFERHEDGRPNYTCRVLTDVMEDRQPITAAALRKACLELFSPRYKDDVLFYFSGHGALTHFGGILCAADAKQDNWGVSMQEVMQMALSSSARDITVILDCCNAGSFADLSFLRREGKDPLSLLREDMTVMAASRDYQPASEAGGHGRFTAAVLDALRGGAAEHMGWVTAPSIYSYAERRFSDWDMQRPVYKAHTTGVTVIRECSPLIERFKLHRLIRLFETADFKYQLDPEFEPEDEHGNLREPVNHEKVEIARLFKDYRDAGLLKPSVPGEQLYWTARRSHTVELTPRGREYWLLVMAKRI